MLGGVWIRRVLDRLAADDRAALLLGGDAYGAPYLIEHLGRNGPLAWLRASASDRGDPVAQGNLLAAALNRAVGGELFPSAVPYAYQLRALRHYRGDLTPMIIAISEAQHVPELAHDLAALHDGAFRVVATSPQHLGGDWLEVPARELALSAEEARSVAPHELSDEQVRLYHKRSEGRIVEFLSLAQREVGLPLPSVPAPDARMVPPDQARGEEPRLVVRALQREGRWTEALELAVMAVPELVDDLLRMAGPRFQEEGLLSRLGLLLDALPDPYRTTERVLEWRLVSGLARGDMQEIAIQADEHLAAFEAPELRARRAGTIAPERGLEMAREALGMKVTPLTLFQAGRTEPEDGVALELLLRSVRVAEEVGVPYDVVRNAGALASRYLQAGRLDEAVSWGRWTLEAFDRHRLRDGNRRLLIFNDLAVARLLQGDSAGLRASLEEAQESLEGVLPLRALSFRNTIALLELMTGRDGVALELARSIFAASPRGLKGRFAYQYVRAALGTGRIGEARRVASEVMSLSLADGPTARAPARLAQAMVAARDGDPGAGQELLSILEQPNLQIEASLTASLYLLAVGEPHERVPQRWLRALQRMPDMALRALCGPESLGEAARAALRGERTPVTLRVVGRPEARLNGCEVRLPGRLWEVALALALHPKGTSDERLLDYLVGESGAFGLAALRTHVSRLRALLPISETPYRWRVPVEVDVLRARELLAARRVREALALLDGEILPGSTASGIVYFREQVEEELRQAVLAANDAEALLELAERLGDDLELWEAAEAALADGDPRRPLARARVARLRREYEGDPDDTAPDDRSAGGTART